MKLAPVVLFVYNRHGLLRATVEALRRNDLAKESELFIFSDAARIPSHENDVAKVRKYIKKINGFKKITIIERGRNWGLAKNIIDGVSSIVNKYGRVIVVEDDLVTSRYFLRFMNEALKRYDKVPKVMHISGYIYPINKAALPSTFFLLGKTSCWGWATWKRAWKYFDNDDNAGNGYAFPA